MNKQEKSSDLAQFSKKSQNRKKNKKSSSKEQDKLVEQELEELISNLDLLKPVDRNWKYHASEFYGQIIITTLAITFLGFYLWTLIVVPPNAKLFGIEIGGKTAAKTFQLLNIEVKDKVNNPLTIKTPQGVVTVLPQQIGMELDLPGSVNGIRKNMVTFIKSSLLPTELKPSISINENTLKFALTRVVQQNTNSPINATLTTQGGKVVSTEAVDGTEIDWEKTQKSLRDSWLHQGRQAEIVISYIPPKVSNEDVNKVRANLAELAIAAPITIKIGSREVKISPEVIGTALEFVPNKEKLESKFDEQVIISEISRQIPNIKTTASDAQFEFSGNKITILPAQEGIKFMPGQLDAAFSPVFRQKKNRVVNLDSAVIKPIITTESLAALGIKEQLSSFRQGFDYMP